MKKKAIEEKTERGTVSIHMDLAVAKEFDKFCDEKGLIKSKLVERFMKKIISGHVKYSDILDES